MQTREILDRLIAFPSVFTAEAYDETAATLVKAFVDNFAQFEDHVDDGVRGAALTAA